MKPSTSVFLKKSLSSQRPQKEFRRPGVGKMLLCSSTVSPSHQTPHKIWFFFNYKMMLLKKIEIYMFMS